MKESFRHHKKYFLIFVSLIIFHVECESPSAERIISVKPIALPLSGSLKEPYAEISGLCWIEDQLMVLPQYPDRFSQSGMGSIFRIPAQAIKEILSQQKSTALCPFPVAIDDRAVISQIQGFQGYEAIAHIGKRIFLTIESVSMNGMQAYLVQGILSDDWKQITLDPASCLSLELPAQVHNISYETLIVAREKLLVVYELNGLNINPHPLALLVNPETGEIQKVEFPRIEYRITDATSLDEHGNFWVLNYYWPGEYQKIKPAEDLLAGIEDTGLNFDREKSVERLIELHFANSRVSLSGRKPVYLDSDPGSEGRNWEGLVRFDHQGFLIVTDKHPRTILAFAGADSASSNF